MTKIYISLTFLKSQIFHVSDAGNLILTLCENITAVSTKNADSGFKL